MMPKRRDQNVRQNNDIQISNRSFEMVEQLKYLGGILTSQSCIHVEIKSRLKSGNACYHSVQNLLSSSLLLEKCKHSHIQNYGQLLYMGVKLGRSH